MANECIYFSSYNAEVPNLNFMQKIKIRWGGGKPWVILPSLQFSNRDFSHQNLKWWTFSRVNSTAEIQNLFDTCELSIFFFFCFEVNISFSPRITFFFNILAISFLLLSVLWTTSDNNFYCIIFCENELFTPMSNPWNSELALGIF